MTKLNISVAMCTFNGEAYIREQMISILNQTKAPYELIICDDRSDDNTMSLVKGLISEADFPVSIYSQERNVGVNRNFAKAISMCTGEYIALADQDDIWDENKLKVFADEILKSGMSRPALLYSRLELINDEGSLSRQNFAQAAKLARSGRPEWLELAFGNFIPGCSMLFDSRYVKEVLPIPQEAILHDWWIALVISLHGNLKYIDRELIAYRVHESNNQGINSLKRTISMVFDFGFLTISRNNFLLALRQLQAANERLRQYGHLAPCSIAKICEIERRGRFLRPIILLKSGVRRASALLGSVLIKSGQLVDDHMRYL